MPAFHLEFWKRCVSKSHCFLQLSVWNNKSTNKYFLQTSFKKTAGESYSGKVENETDLLETKRLFLFACFKAGLQLQKLPEHFFEKDKDRIFVKSL